MPNLNTVVLCGHLTRDPQPPQTVGANGTQLTSFGLAVSEKGRNGQQKPHFFDVKCWAGLAVEVAAHLKKGDAAVVIGMVCYESWQGKDGKKVNRLTIRADIVAQPLYQKQPPAGAPAAATGTETSAAAPETEDDVPF